MFEDFGGPNVLGGAVTVTVNGRTSNANLMFTPNGGRIRYVAGSGSDAAGCTEAAPCASISHAIESSVTGPGDTILVRGGTLQENEIWVRREYGHGGTPGQQKTIKAYPGETVTLANGARPFILDADYVTVSGFRFLNGKSLGVPETGDANRHKGDRLLNNSYAGAVDWSFIDSHGDNHTIAGNVCDATTSTVGTQGHCYYISYGDGVNVRYNIGGGAPGYGIHVFDQRRASVDFKRVISNLLIEGNIVRNNILTGNNHLGLTMGGQVRNVKIYNNTFVENGRQALYIGSGALLSNIDVRNNLFVQSENGVCQSNCSWYSVAHMQVDPSARNVTVVNNGYVPGAATFIGASDPTTIGGSVAFVDPVQLDFRVQPGGSSIDKGTPLADVPVDYLGVRRPNGAAFDLGAFEVPASTTGQAPSAPTNVRIRG